MYFSQDADLWRRKRFVNQRMSEGEVRRTILPLSSIQLNISTIRVNMKMYKLSKLLLWRYVCVFCIQVNAVSNATHMIVCKFCGGGQLEVQVIKEGDQSDSNINCSISSISSKSLKCERSCVLEVSYRYLSRFWFPPPSIVCSSTSCLSRISGVLQFPSWRDSVQEESNPRRRWQSVPELKTQDLWMEWFSRRSPTTPWPPPRSPGFSKIMQHGLYLAVICDGNWCTH